MSNGVHCVLTLTVCLPGPVLCSLVLFPAIDWLLLLICPAQMWIMWDRQSETVWSLTSDKSSRTENNKPKIGPHLSLIDHEYPDIFLCVSLIFSILFLSSGASVTMERKMTLWQSIWPRRFNFRYNFPIKLICWVSSSCHPSAGGMVLSSRHQQGKEEVSETWENIRMPYLWCRQNIQLWKSECLISSLECLSLLDFLFKFRDGPEGKRLPWKAT